MIGVVHCHLRNAGGKYGMASATPITLSVWMDPIMVVAKFEVRSFTRSGNNSDWSFWWSCEPQSWGSRGRRGSGIVPLERALLTSYRPSIVTFPLSLRGSEILPLLCSRTPLYHPTSSRPKINLCSHRSRWVAFGLRRATLLG